jgi:hypothetical protein
MKTLVIDSQHQRGISAAIIAGLLSVPLLAGIFFRSEIRSALVYCRETLILQYGTHPLMVVGLALLMVISVIGCLNLVLFWLREVRQTSNILRWAQLRLVAAHERILLVEAPEALAITIGYLRPTIIYSTGLLALLSDDEVEAVLAHEIAHQMRRDPLRRLALYSLMKICFFWPALKSLTRYYINLQEARADQAASVSVGKEVLVSSMKKVLATVISGHSTVSSCAFAFNPERLLVARENGAAVRFQFTAWELGGSALTMAVVLTATLMSATAVRAGTDGLLQHNQLCQYVADHNVVVGFSPLVTMSSDHFEPAPDAYLVWRP